MAHFARYAVIAAVLAAALWPLTWDPAVDDSFPLSTYPMFSRGKPTAVVALDYVIATEADGTRHHVPPELVANGEVMQAQRTVNQAVSRRRAPELCARIAERLARRGGAWSRVVAVHVVHGKHDAVALLRGGDQKGREWLRASCEVDR